MRTEASPYWNVRFAKERGLDMYCWTGMTLPLHKLGCDIGINKRF